MEETREELQEELEKTKMELDRILKEQFPIVMSKFLDKELAAMAAGEHDVYRGGWHEFGFPYKRLNDEFLSLLGLQYGTKNVIDLFRSIGEREIMDFLNRFYRFHFSEEGKIWKFRRENPLTLTEEEEKEFARLCAETPDRWKEPLTVWEYLHMCRIGFDAAPDFVYPDYVSDLYVVAHEKFDSCGITKRDMDKKMKLGDKYMYAMHYHPEEMGFGSPTVHFRWDEENLEDGWLLSLWWEKGYKEKHVKNVKRFIAMRKAGYPVICSLG